MSNDIHSSSLTPGDYPATQHTAPAEVQRFVSRPQFTVRHTATASCDFDSHSHSGFTVSAVLAGRISVTNNAGTFEISTGETALTNVGENHSARGAEIEF